MPRHSRGTRTKSNYLFEDQNRRSDGCCPQGLFITHCRLRDIRGANNLVGESVNFFLFVPTFVWIELDIESGGEHFRREFFRVVTGNVVGFAEGVVFTEIAVGAVIGGLRHANA